MKALFFKYALYPVRPKLMKHPGKEPKKKKPAEKTGAESRKKKKKAGITETLDLITDLVKRIFPRFRKHLRLYSGDTEIVIATGDAAQTAVLYGAVCPAVSALWTFVKENTHRTFGSRDPVVLCDFTGESTSYRIDLRAGIRVGEMLAIAFTAALAFLRHKSASAQTAANTES